MRDRNAPHRRSSLQDIGEVSPGSSSSLERGQINSDPLKSQETKSWVEPYNDARSDTSDSPSSSLSRLKLSSKLPSPNRLLELYYT